MAQSVTLAVSKLTANFLCLRLEAEPGVCADLGGCFGGLSNSCMLIGGGVLLAEEVAVAAECKVSVFSGGVAFPKSSLASWFFRPETRFLVTWNEK